MSEVSGGTQTDGGHHTARNFIIDLQPKRPGANRTAACRGCRVSFEPGELRACPVARKKARGGWYVHLHFVQGGWQPDDRMQADDLIWQSHAHEFASRGVQPTPIEAVEVPDADMTDANGSVAAGTPVEDPAIAPRHPTTDSSGSGDKVCFEENVLRSLDWWDNIDVPGAIKQKPVPTWEGAHASLEQGIEEGKLSILKLIWQKDGRWLIAWKLLLMYDRLLYARTPAKLRPEGVTATQHRKNVVASRLRRLWRGEWQSLWDEAHIMARAMPSEEPEEAEGLAKIVARIEALGAAQEWGKALKAIDNSNILATAPCHLTELESKLPPERVRGLIGRDVDPALHSESWDDVTRAVKKLCRRLPRKSGPSLDGSRFEHWSAPATLSA